MKRIITIIIATLAAAAVFVGLVLAILKTAHLSGPAANTVQGFTNRRLWATTASLLALAGLILGIMATRQSTVRVSLRNLVNKSVVAFAAGLIAVVNGVLNIAIAKGGPGTGNGVVGGAVAIVLGLAAMVLGAIALNRAKSTPNIINNKNH